MLLLFSACLKSQKVDSVKAVQAGDYIKITYKILNSTKRQVFKVSIQCSVNGGLSGDIKSYSGDAGERVAGGKPEYLVLWDVFKDVDDVSSVEFTVRAELIEGIPTKLQPVNLTGWDRKMLQVVLICQDHGPKVGCKIGYYDNWGMSVEFAIGKMDSHRAGFTVPYKSLPVKTYFNLDLTKRFVNHNDIQSYFLLGLSANPLLFGKSTDINDFEVKYLAGLHTGISIGINRIVFCFGINAMPTIGATEKANDLLIISSDTYLDFGLGLRF